MDIPFRGLSKSTVAYILENVILKIYILYPIILFLCTILMFIFPNSEFTLHDTKQRSDVSSRFLLLDISVWMGHI